MDDGDSKRKDARERLRYFFYGTAITFAAQALYDMIRNWESSVLVNIGILAALIVVILTLYAGYRFALLKYSNRTKEDKTN